jgi:hypothetical protein
LTSRRASWSTSESECDERDVHPEWHFTNIQSPLGRAVRESARQ